MITIDTKELEKLERGLKQYASILPKSVANSALRNVTRPILKSVRSEVPAGTKKGGSGGERKGGATRKDTRSAIVKPKEGEVTRIIIGVSKRKGKVGWRTHFITRGFTDRGGRRHAANDFLTRALNSNLGVAAASFGREVALSFQKWAKKNLPQGRF